jgi:uncharacterized membrane protein
MDAGIAVQRAWRALCSPAVQRGLAWLIVCAAIAVYMVLVGLHTLMRYHAYRAQAFDLGNMDQALWNTLHGHPFRFTNRGLDWNGPPTRLGIHVEPIILLIAPLYLIHSGPETLLVLQTVALALGAIPLLLLALRRLPDVPLLGAAIACAYLAAPTLFGEALWDFHAVALATPLLLLALWALDAEHYGWFLAAAVLATLTKEDVALSLIPLGVFIAVWRGRPRLGGAIVALSIAWVCFCFAVVLPHFDGGASGGNNYWYRYAWLGASPRAAIFNVLTHPWLPITGVLAVPAKRAYLATLLRTGGSLGLFAPGLWICGLPELAVNILSTHEEQYSGFFQYNAVLLAYLMAGAVYGAATLYGAYHPAASAGAPPAAAAVPGGALAPLGRLDAWMARLRDGATRLAVAVRTLLARLPIPRQLVAPAMVLWLVITAVWNLHAADPRVASFWRAGDGPAPQQAQVDALLAKVPATASVATTDSLDPHLSDRVDLYLMPDPQSYSAEYVAVDLSGAIALNLVQDRRMYAIMQASGRYTVVGSAPNVVLLHRVGPPLTAAEQAALSR